MCATLQLPQFKFYSLPWRVSQTGGISIELKGEKSCGNSAIILRLTCGIGDFCQFLTVSGRTTACKRGIRFYYGNKEQIQVVDNYLILSLISMRELSNFRPLEFVQRLLSVSCSPLYSNWYV